MALIPSSSTQQILTSIHHFDVAAFYWCLRRKHLTALINVSRILSRTADGPPYILCALAFVVQGWYLQFVILAIGLSAERGCYFLLKNLFKRNRPPAALPNFTAEVTPSDQFSFPSGHTSAAFLMAGLLCGLFPGWELLLYPWACLVGASRVMLGVHFPTDIIAGATLGTTLSLQALNYL